VSIIDDDVMLMAPLFVHSKSKHCSFRPGKTQLKVGNQHSAVGWAASVGGIDIQHGSRLCLRLLVSSRSAASGLQRKQMLSRMINLLTTYHGVSVTANIALFNTRTNSVLHKHHKHRKGQKPVVVVAVIREHTHLHDALAAVWKATLAVPF
jgi:hypothetical protein